MNPDLASGNRNGRVRRWRGVCRVRCVPHGVRPMDSPACLVSTADRRAIPMVADDTGQRLGQLLRLLEILVEGPGRDRRPVGGSPGSTPHAAAGNTRGGRTRIAITPQGVFGRPGSPEEHTLSGSRRRCRRQRGYRMIRRRAPAVHRNRCGHAPSGGTCKFDTSSELRPRRGPPTDPTRSTTYADHAAGGAPPV